MKYKILSIAIAILLSLSNFTSFSKRIASYDEAAIDADGGAANELYSNEKNKLNELDDFQGREDLTDLNILFIGDDTEELENLKAMNAYTDNTKFDAYISENEVPYKLTDLLKYDEVVLSNTRLTWLNNSYELVFNLERYVKEYGKSLMTYGDTSYYYMSEDGDDSSNPYMDLLPLSNEKNTALRLLSTPLLL